MEDDRDRWLFEINQQADGLAGYFVSLLGIDNTSKPWTMELIRCGLAMGNVVYMNYKALFKRVRPSFLCPGLVPPFGPPRHPAFPSGHAFLGHFIALLLLEIDPIRIRFGEDPLPVPPPPVPPPPRPLGKDVRFRQGVKPRLTDVMHRDVVFGGPLLWLAERLGRNRERLGVHYPSDSAASRWLAGAICALLVTPEGNRVTGTPNTWPDLDNLATPPGRDTNVLHNMTPAELIDCPALKQVLGMAKGEWA